MRAISLQGAIEKSPKLISQYWRNEPFESKFGFAPTNIFSFSSRAFWGLFLGRQSTEFLIKVIIKYKKLAKKMDPKSVGDPAFKLYKIQTFLPNKWRNNIIWLGPNNHSRN